MYVHNLGQKFKQVAMHNGDRPAAHIQGETLSYAELDRQSDVCAGHLLARGIRRGDVICLAGVKERSSLVAVLGCLKAGVTYSFFDPASPLERLLKIFQTCAPALVLAETPMVARLREHGFATVTLAELCAEFDNDAAPLPAEQLDAVPANCPAYIMFTSGSTGFPKGAAMTHQNVLNLVAWSRATYEFTPADVLTNINPFYFDNSVFDLYSALFTGASLALFDIATVRNPGRLMTQINELGCTSWFSVPSMLIYLLTMRALQPQNMRSIRRIIFGGEGFPKAKLKQVFDTYAARIRFFNVYGPTECTCICSSYEITAADFDDLAGFPPLGQLIANFDYLILNDQGEMAGPGEVGELLLLGPNVGLGYVNDPKRTAASFVQNPLHTKYPEVVYRTGDLVYADAASGTLHIRGRADNQVKHMGHRIELEEIENAISQIRGIEHAGVIHCEIRGFSRIVGFLHCTGVGWDEETLRARLGEIIPQYMIPTEFVFTEHLPRNVNGKLDRKRLRADYLEQQLDG